MGQIFSQLTKTGTMDPNTGQTNYGTPDPGTKLAARPLSIDTPPVLNPQQVQPSFQQAASMGATPGGANVASPALTKAGKLATLLSSGLQGALAGRAASEQAIIQSGGRRSGGAGMGFEAGYTLPWQRAQQLSQAQIAQGSAAPVQTPYGQMPAALASKILSPYLGYQGKIGAANIGAEAKKESAQTEAGGRVAAAEVNRRFMAVPNVGLFDTNSRQVVPGTQQGVTVTPEIAQEYQLPQDFIGKPMSLANLSSLEGAQARQTTTVMGSGGPALVNKKTAKTTPLGLGVPSLGGAQEIADPNNPGETTFTTKANAIRTGASGPQSASVQVPRAAARAEVPTNIGNQKVAFNTALQHADLLQAALNKLNNPKDPSNVRAWNSVKNRFETEFGSSDVTNFETIAHAYSDEVQKMLSGGHITEGEQKLVNGKLPANASPEQILGALQQYRALAQSKMNQLNTQKNAAVNQSQKGSSKGSTNAPANDPFAAFGGRSR